MSTENQCAMAVVGAGQMGGGIAQTIAANHGPVTLVDVSAEALDKTGKIILQSLQKLESKGKLASAADDIYQQIQFSTQISDISKTAQLVVEAVSENPDLKKTIFQQLDEHCSADTILASNTSAISITRMASMVSHPQRFIGMHFMNPVPLMPLVEIIRGIETSDETYQKIHDLSLALGKTPVEVNDSFGFVSNRILMPMINEAAFCLYEGVSEAEEIDKVMTLGMRHPMGPLALADLIGLDTCLAIMNVLYEGFADSKYRPCPLLKQYVAAGRTGKKSGQGFYRYDQ